VCARLEMRDGVFVLHRRVAALKCGELVEQFRGQGVLDVLADVGKLFAAGLDLVAAD
jgi:hypothetical protein